MSGVVRATIAAISCVPPSTGAPWTRRRRSLRVVVDEAEDALAAGLAQLAQEAPAGAARTDDQRPSAGAVAGATRVPPMTARSARRETEIAAAQKSASIDEERAREVAERAGRGT